MLLLAFSIFDEGIDMFNVKIKPQKSSMTELQINNFIDSLHFRSFKRVADAVKKRFPNTTNKELRNIIKKRIHDKHMSRERRKIYQVRVFSTFPNSWMADIYDNLVDHDPRFWYLFININTRFAEAYPMRDKTKDSINTVLHLFVNRYRPRKITSDEEAGLVAKVNVDYLKTNKCGLYIIQEKNHSALSLIDRFVRTLRDMNQPQNIEPKDSHDEEFKFIDKNKMTQLLNLYNNTIHAATGLAPSFMMANQQYELDYIEKCIDNKLRQEEIKDFKLKIGSLVRYYLDNDPMTKKRSSLSREAYKIESRTGNIYTIMALDGTTKDLSRWRLIAVDPNEKFVLGKTLGTDKGVVEEIVKETTPNKVEVKFKMPDGSNYTKEINKRELRYPTPQFESKLEIDFKNKNKGH